MGFSPHNLGVIICSHVLDASRPVLLVVRDSDGWNFACGSRDHSGADDFHVVGVGHLVARDPSLDQCSDLEVGFLAERPDSLSRWARQRIPDDEA